MKLNVLCNNEEQLYAALSNEKVDTVIVEADAVDRPVIDICHENGKKAAIALPYIFRDLAYVETDGYDEVYVRSLDELQYYHEKKPMQKLVADYGLYSMNRMAGTFLREHGISRLTAPVELNEGELKNLGLSDKELIVYGHIPMMISAQCVRKNTRGCDSTHGFMNIRDRTDKLLTVENKCAYCYNLIYNPNPLSLAGCFDRVRRLQPDTVRINLTIEDGEQSERVISTFAGAVAGKNVSDSDGEYTRGHFTRGVE